MCHQCPPTDPTVKSTMNTTYITQPHFVYTAAKLATNSNILTDHNCQIHINTVRPTELNCFVSYIENTITLLLLINVINAILKIL